MRNYVYFLLVGVLVAEGGGFACNLLSTPCSYLAPIFYAGSPIKVPYITVWIILGLIMGGVRRPKTLSKQVVNTLLLTLVGVAWCFFWGSITVTAPFMLTDPTFKDRIAVMQIIPIVTTVLFAALIARVLTSPDDFMGLNRIIIWCAMWRAFVCLLFYITVLLPHAYDEYPEYCTTHDDSVLFSTALILILATAMETRSKKDAKFAMWAVPWILMGIQLNNRRLAWVSIAFAVILVYAIYPMNDLKKKINKRLKQIGPVILIYVVVGKQFATMPNPPVIFKPLSSIFSAGDKNNPSTRSRVAENEGLIVSFQASPIFGFGFGHMYYETDNTLSARGFELYRYITHNSVLGLVAFGGVVGYYRIWFMFPMTIFFAVRILNRSSDPKVRIGAIAAAAEVAICANQAYGDMGLGSFTTMLILATGQAFVARMSIPTGLVFAIRAPKGLP